jgi:AcrR family transcriptional regulator
MSSPTRKTHRDALLEAAKTLVRERGYGNISARDLVAASDTNLASIGYHFGSKEALLNEAIGEALEEWAETIRSATRDDPAATPMERIAGAGRAALEDFEQIRPYFVAFVEALARSARSPELAAQLATHYERQRARVAGILTDALGDSIDPDDARRLATAMIAVTDGLMLQSFVDPERAPSSTELAATAGKAFARMLHRSGSARAS